MSILNRILVATALVSSVVAAPAFADPVIYTTAEAFSAANPGASLTNFTVAGLSGVGSSYSLNGTTFTAAGGSLTGYNDAYGAPYLSSNGTGAIDVTTGASAIGFYLGSYFGAQTIAYSFAGLTGNLSVPAPNSTTFIGFSNTTGQPLTIALSNASELDVTKFVSVTSAVPEPATWAMMLIGFGGVGFAMRRRNNVRTAVSLV